MDCSAPVVSFGRRLIATALWVSTLLAIPALGQDTGSTARQAATRSVNVTTAAKPGSAKPAPAGGGFTIERAPSWVQALSADASINLPAAPVQILLWDRQTRVERAGTVRFVHFIRQVNDASGLQKGAQIELEFDPSYQKLALHQLVLWRGTQRIDKLNRKKVKLLHREMQLERQIVDGRMTASIVLDDLRVGDRIEWAASLTGDNPVFGGRFVDSEWSEASLGPVALLQLRLLAPAERNIRYRTAEPSVEVSSQIRNGWRETQFRRRAVAQFRYDPQLPPGEFLKDLIEFSEFSDWAEVASWAGQLFGKAIVASDAVEARVAAIQAQAATPAERLRVALDFVQKDVRYFGTEIGPNSHQPASADTVLRQRFGDCKDKVALLATLLGRLGFEVTPVLVSTQFGNQTPTRLPSPLAFNHAIAGVSFDGQMLWLDGTRSQQSGAPATRQPTGLGHGLLAKAGATTLTALPASRDALRSETIDTFSFMKLAQEGRFESVTTYHGDMAEWLREVQASMPVADFEKALTEEVLRTYPSLVPEGHPVVEPVANRNALKITLRFRTGNYWRFPEQRLLVGDFALLGLMAPLRLPDQTPRTQPLRVNMPGRYLHTVRFVFGEEVYSQASSKQLDETNGQFELQVRYSGQPNEQVIEGELRQVTDVIEAADWARHRDQLTKIWPRLVNTISVPVLSPAQAESMRKELAALDEAVRRGSVKVLTRDQFTARARLIVLSKQLVAGRLPEKLRAEAFVAQGIQLDHLGRSTEAQDAFQRSIELDKGNAEAHAALAVNALARRQDQEALVHANQALQLSPTKVDARYTRAWAHYFAGDMAQARDELQGILKSRSEVENGYGAIWLYLATRRLGGDGVAAVQPFAPTASKPEWPHAVLQLMSGRIDFDAALAATRDGKQPDRGRECELYFYAAQKALLDSDIATARSYLQKSLATGVVEFNEYAMAKRELERIGQ